MQNRFDLAGYSSDDELVLLVEVKSMKEPSVDRAAQFRKNLFDNQLLDLGPFFLLAYRNCFYLWKGDSAPGAKPDFSASAQPVFGKYLGEQSDAGRHPGSESMEFALKMWLGELVNGWRVLDERSESDQMLRCSGLADRLKGGQIRRGDDE